MVQAPRSIRSKQTFSIALLLAGSSLTTAAQAHFPWLIRTPEGLAALFFGEGLADRTYKLPPAIAKADNEGKVALTDAQIEEGLNAIMVGQTLNEAGTLAEKTYAFASLYLTLTSVDPEHTDPENTDPENTEPAPSAPAKTDTSSLPPIPFSITSFGAARCADSIYIYGGHTGTAHSYYDESQSNKLLKLDLNEQQAGWQEVAEGERLQGLGMVAHGERVILVGGFSAKNKQGEEHDLHSQSTVRAFDAKTNQWSELPALPAGRSSHDAAVIGDTLYVVGGWNMSGSAETEWHTTALAMDLSAAEPQWQPLPEPPFQRRAIATVAHAGKLFVIGGMNQAGGPTRAVEIFDPKSQKWESTSELHGESAMAGFGAAGWSVDGQLTVTTYEGDIQLYDDATKSWKVLGQTAEARFFHRLIPLATPELVQIGGANMESGKFLELEVVTRR